MERGMRKKVRLDFTVGLNMKHLIGAIANR